MKSPKDLAAIVMPKLPGSDGPEMSDAEHAAEEFQDAVKNGSPSDVVETFKALMQLCDSDESDESEEPSEDQEQ